MLTGKPKSGPGAVEDVFSGALNLKPKHTVQTRDDAGLSELNRDGPSSPQALPEKQEG